MGTNAPVALLAVRSLLSTATNYTPHERLFRFERSSLVGTDLPEFLLNPGHDILHRRHLRSKGDPLVERVTLLETISPYFARVQFANARVDTVSTRHLAPLPLANDHHHLVIPGFPYDNTEPTSDFDGSERPDVTATTDDLPPNHEASNIPDNGEPQFNQTTRSGRVVKPPLRLADYDLSQ